MRIIIDGIIERLQANGGCTVYFNHVLHYLQRDKYKLHYISYADDKMANGNILLDGENTVADYSDFRFMERWRDVDVSKYGEGVIFHSTHYRLPRQKVKTVTTVHDFTYELYRRGPAQWMHSWQKFRAIRNSDLIICVSHNTAKDLMRFCPVTPEKIRVVHNGVSDVYTPSSIYDKTNEVVFVGARGWYKNFAMAVEALKCHPELKLSIVGGGALTPDEMALLDTNIPDRYQWLGRVSDEDLNIIYNRAHCLLYPSSYEGFGIPVIEAMKAGCPVIAVRSSSIPEVAGDAAILVEQAEVMQFDRALNTLRDANFRSEMIQNGFIQAGKFSWEKCYQDTLAVYKELAE